MMLLVEFGKGEVIVGAGKVRGEKASFVSFRKSVKPLPIGEMDVNKPVETDNDYPAVFFKFYNVESIDILMRSLVCARERLQEGFNGATVTPT